MRTLYQRCIFGLFVLAFPSTAYSQIVPDNTVGTRLAPNALINGDIINGGAIRGNNLFHSFQEFNINTGRSVYFTNPTDVTNIFTRVTGANPSNINGTLGILGDANLFLMNPNGIIFGSSAALDVKGSFLGTTASLINFFDGTVFSSNSCPDVTCNVSTTILSVSAPVGLGFGSQPGKITVEGQGHNLTMPNRTRSLNGLGNNTTGLRVQPNKKLALLGGEINLNGGILSTNGGQIELGSIRNGTASLNLTGDELKFNYESVKEFADIRLSKRAMIDTSASGGGSIQLFGNNIFLNSSSIIAHQNQGNAPAGNITINAKNVFEISGIDTNKTFPSLLLSETVAGKAANIFINANQLNLQNSGFIYSRTFSSVSGADVTVNADNSVNVDGMQDLFANVPSGIVAHTVGSGNSGKIDINTQKLEILNGGLVTSTSLGQGNGEGITINASDSVKVSGFSSRLGQPSILSSATHNRGNGGNLTINTSRFTASKGAIVSTNSLASGDAGNLNINASDFIEVDGSDTPDPNSFPTAISSSARNIPDLVKRVLNITNPLVGNAKNLTLNTRNLKVTDGAIIVSNDGTGNAGQLQINANNILLDNQGKISGQTQKGEGGNITLNVRNTLQLRRDSTISTTAQTQGNGGDIFINAGAIALLEKSTISANALQGKGGNIVINTQGLFKSPDSKITATGTLNDGEIKIIRPNINKDNALQEQEVNFVETDKVVSSSCLASRNIEQGTFVVTANGGLPTTPKDNFDLAYEVVKIQAVNYGDKITSPQPNSRAWKIGDPIMEAKSLQVINGRVILTATNSDEQLSQTSYCNRS